ncbi:MAG: TlpA disulfide reductase family protein [Candidatus Omnitrophica bacterium]|nr:TlpA disulfide reductase family protein [Candidatus Omnitrophota bacterium]MDD5352886.1 TlpA disulfide reductase family protein [Candidatus Omnitrophota bacterium]MDD5550485.1 TlpA disulfide reductase family protein [Candidatus Omnitrophota bacterium]
MRKIITVVFALCLVLALCFDSSSFYSMQNKNENQQAPGFTLVNLSGKNVSLSDFKGKAVVLFFLTTSCPYCRQELPLLNKEYPNMLASGIELLAIDITESKERVANFAQRYYIKYPVLLDLDGMVSMQYDIIGVPTLILISKEGKVISVENDLPSDYKERMLK